MINYLTVTGRDGRRTLAILNTQAEDVAPQIEHAKTVRNLAGAEFASVRVEVARSSYKQEVNLCVESEIARAIADRAAWTMYDAKGAVIGSGANWGDWYVKSPLVDNGVLAVFALRQIEQLR